MERYLTAKATKGRWWDIPVLGVSGMLTLASISVIVTDRASFATQPVITALADLVVLGAPYWEYQFPALVRCYLEHITGGGVTFTYGEDGRPHGLCKAGRLLYITTAGGPILDRNCGFDYVKTLCGQMLQIPSIQWVGAECLDVWGEDVAARLAQAETSLRETVRSWD